MLNSNFQIDAEAAREIVYQIAGADVEKVASALKSVGPQARPIFCSWALINADLKTAAAVEAWEKAEPADPSLLLDLAGYEEAEPPPTPSPAREAGVVENGPDWAGLAEEEIPDKMPPARLDQPVPRENFPHQNRKGGLLNTLENMQSLIDSYGITARYNEMTKMPEIDIPGEEYPEALRANCAIDRIVSLCGLNEMPRTQAPNYAKTLAAQNSYHPVKDWIDAKPWDGVSRFSALCDTIKSEMDPALKEALLLRWMLAAVALLYRTMPSRSALAAHGAIVFTGSQGTGKTAWIQRLVPAGAAKDGASIEPGNKDNMMNVLSYFIVEIGELDGTFRKQDIARLKAFITEHSDIFRMPYERAPSRYPRQTVFFGSVNDSQYLVDDTGNRRWWTIPVESINYMHQIDVQQVWAEIKVRYEAGEQWWLTDDERRALDVHNEDFEAVDPVEEQIRARFDWGAGGAQTTEMTATEVLKTCGFKSVGRGEANRASKVLEKLTGQKARRTKSGRYFDLPAKIHSQEDEPWGNAF